MVILMPLCRMAMGKRGEGLLESHRRKSGWGFRASKPSTILSRAGSQLVIKWQLAKNTQWPAAMPSWISLLAIGACTPHALSYALFISRSTVINLADCSIGSYLNVYARNGCMQMQSQVLVLVSADVYGKRYIQLH